MIKPKKSLGQNFLVDSRVVARIVDSVSPGPDDIVIEIGPGEGALTAPLVERAGYVAVVEIDPRLADHLRSRIQNENFRLIQSDALAIDWADLFDDVRRRFFDLRLRDGTIRIVANLPYYISTPIIERLMRSGRSVLDMTLMLQREVVERIASGPGSKEYGYMSVLVQYHCRVAKLFDVPPSAFKPAPKVWSSVVRLATRERPAVEVDDEDRFFALVRTAFAQRRKTLGNNLKAIMHSPEMRERDDTIFERAGIDPMRRAETLSLEEFGSLYRALYNE